MPLSYFPYALSTWYIDVTQWDCGLEPERSDNIKASPMLIHQHDRALNARTRANWDDPLAQSYFHNLDWSGLKKREKGGMNKPGYGKRP